MTHQRQGQWTVLICICTVLLWMFALGCDEPRNYDDDDDNDDGSSD